MYDRPTHRKESYLFTISRQNRVLTKGSTIQVVPSQISSDMTDKQPHLLSGSEVTYSRIVVDSEQEVLALAHGDSVKVLYEE